MQDGGAMLPLLYSSELLHSIKIYNLNAQ